MDYSCLPNEVLERIFGNNSISVGDLGRLMVTCKRFRDFICDSNLIWKQKFLSRYTSRYYPSLIFIKIEIVNFPHPHFINRWPWVNHLKDRQHPHQWMSLAQQKIKTADRVHRGLISMSAACYPHGEPSIAQMTALIGNDPQGFVEDELLQIIFHTDEYKEII